MEDVATADINLVKSKQTGLKKLLHLNEFIAQLSKVKNFFFIFF